MPLTGIEKWVLEKIADLVFEAVKAGVVQPLVEQHKVKNRVRRPLPRRCSRCLLILIWKRFPRRNRQGWWRNVSAACARLPSNRNGCFAARSTGRPSSSSFTQRLSRSKNLPEVIREDGTEGLYSLLIPRIADLICKVPAAVKDWESLSVKETLHRLDEVGEEQRRAAELQVKVYAATLRIEEKDAAH